MHQQNQPKYASIIATSRVYVDAMRLDSDIYIYTCKYIETLKFTIEMTGQDCPVALS